MCIHKGFGGVGDDGAGRDGARGVHVYGCVHVDDSDKLVCCEH